LRITRLVSAHQTNQLYSGEEEKSAKRDEGKDINRTARAVIQAAVLLQWQSVRERYLLHIGTIPAYPQLRQQAFGCDRQRPLNPATAGAFVSTATKRRCHYGHVHRSFAAQTYAKAAVGLFPKEQCHLNAFDRKGVVHQP